MSNADPYILRADGHMHSSDVRNVAFGYLNTSRAVPSAEAVALQHAHLYPSESHMVVMTSSRDNTACMSRIPTKETPEGKEEEEEEALVGGDAGDDILVQRVFVGHEAFVNFSLLHQEGLDFLLPRPSAEATGEGGRRTPYVVTGSNDSHVLVWSLDPVRLEAVLDGHRSGVTCGDVICHDPSPTSVGAPETKKDSPLDAADYHGDIVTGDWAGSILVFSHHTGKVRAAYNRHENAIRGLVCIPGTTLVASASGDKTVHCWDYVRLAQEGINSLALSGPVSRVLQGHADVVQCICYVGHNGAPGADGKADGMPFYVYLASGSNDCTVRLWAVESQLRDAHAVRTLHGHDSLIYSLCFNPWSGELMSASEDHTVRVWGRPPEAKDEETSVESGASHPVAIDGDASFKAMATTHMVTHPCVVWSVATCRVLAPPGSPTPHEDLLLTGGSDQVVRLWTRNDAHFASVEKLEALEAAIAAQKVDVKVLGAQGGSPVFDMANMPSVEQLHTFRGKTEGEKKFFKNETNEIEVYVWAAGRWDKIGVVVSENQPVSVSSTGQVVNAATGEAAGGKKREKRLYRGRAYDYVFDVDINGRMLQLPYNAGESVLEAAQNFINEHSVLSEFSEEASAAAAASGVSQEHKEQIVNFIMDNIDAADIPKIPGLGGSGGTEAGPSPASYLQEDHLWPTAELLESFSADGAQRKVDEFLATCAPNKATTFATVMSDVQRELCVSGGGSPSTASARQLAQTLADLFAVLPSDKKFPAVDAVRYAVAEAPQFAFVFLLALRPHLAGAEATGSGSIHYTPATDADALVLVRLVSNLLPALMTPQQGEVAVDTTATYARAFLHWALTEAMPHAARMNAATHKPTRLALANLCLRNLSVLLRVAFTEGACAAAEGRQAYAAFLANVGAAANAAEVGSVVEAMAEGFVRTLSPLLTAAAAAATELIPCLLRSAATAAVDGAGTAAHQNFIAKLTPVLTAVPAATELATALKR